MNIITKIKQTFHSFLKNSFPISDQLIQNCVVLINADDKKQAFGDLSSNAALILAKELSQNPRTVAQHIRDNFKHMAIAKIEIAGPGFINIFLTQSALQELAQSLFLEKEHFFTLDQSQKKHNYCIEFISANPTGPLHFGHGRGGIIGDVLGNILTFLGHRVTKEFYINDAGSQIEKLGASFKVRCQQAIGLPAQIPEDGYHGAYLTAIAQEFMKDHNDTIFTQPDQFFADYAKNKLLALIKYTLTAYGITFDVWFSEKTLHESGAIDHAVNVLKEHGYCYEKEDALWFASTKFGDDKDRVIKKSNGQWTYAAADIAYLLNKANRAYDHLIMVLGHDHHSFAIRLHGIAQALQLESIKLDIILYQLVKMKENGLLVQMSKRAGTMITLEDVIQTVGKDVARFFYLHRKTDAQLEFDLELALKKTDENPVYYIQYAYVRIGSILEKAAQQVDYVPACQDDARFITASDSLLLKKMASLKELLETIAANYQTHLLSYYAIELADLFHSYYSQNRVIDLEAPEQTKGRLLLMTLLKQNFEMVLGLLGISCPEKM